jgi:predicted ABC-type ATPase
MRHRYLPLADIGLIYDNSDEGRILIAESAPATLLVLEPLRWRLIEEASQ